jgi:hypothetical protein
VMDLQRASERLAIQPRIVGHDNASQSHDFP